MWMRRTGDGHPTTASSHHPGTMKNVTKDLRIASERAGTRYGDVGQGDGSCVAIPSVPLSSLVGICSLGSVSPDPSLTLMTAMGTRRTGDGDPMMGRLHATGTMKNVTKDLRSGLKRAGTR